MEARMQAELLYALRAITRYMTWSVVLVYLLIIFLLTVVDVGHLKNVKMTKNGKNKTKEEERAAAEGDDKVVLLKEEKKKQRSTEPTCWITCVAARPAVSKPATGGSGAIWAKSL